MYNAWRGLRQMSRTAFAIALILFLFPAAALGQVTLLTPADQAQISSPPTFSWSGAGSYDAYYIQTYFYYEVGQFAGNYMLGTWVTNTSIVMPSTLWDKIGTGNPCYWRVLGFDVDSSQGAWSGIWSFEKTGCPEPTGTTYDVDNVAAMLAALGAAGSGDMVRLAPGTYYPPVQSFSGSGYTNRQANLVVENGTILAGGGGGNVTIVISGSYGNLFAYGNAILRDLTVKSEALGSANLIVWNGSGTLTMCNVVMDATPTLNYGYGMIFAPYEGGSGHLLITDSTIQCSSCTGVTGISLETCSSAIPVTITADIRNTSASGWYDAVSFSNGSCACNGSTTSVTAECDGFFNNTYNVLECPDGGGGVEHCP